MVRYERVKITKDTNTIYNRAVPSWEIPILEFIFGEGNVVPLGVYEEAPYDYPDPAQEHQRLKGKYGVDKETGTDFVAVVYGNSRIGEREVGKAIDAAKRDAVRARALEARAKRAQAVEMEMADPLLA